MKIAVVGGGISGLTSAFLIARRFPDADVHVFEKNDRPGGTVATYESDGFRLETGPNGFLSGKPSTLKVVDMLAAKDRLVEANRAAEKRFILKRGKLVQLPDSPAGFFASGILSPGGKLRIMREPFIKPGTDPDETVAEFGCRRLGPQAVTWMLDPMVSGVFAGNVDNLCLAACFPRIYQLEQEYGSLVRAMLKLRSKKASPSGRLTSFTNGMGELPEMLVASGAFQFHPETPVSGVEKASGVFRLDGVDEPFDAVVMAVPAYVLATMDLPLSHDTRNRLNAVVYPPMAVVPFAVPKGSVDGFGFLIPSVEQRKILGGLFSSRIFPNRGTESHDLVTVMLGGDRHHEVADMDMAEVVDIAAGEIVDILGLPTTKLEHVGLFRWRRAIPQYYRGHLELVRSVEQEVAAVPGLFITGNAFYGIGINDCTQAAFDLADRMHDDQEAGA